MNENVGPRERPISDSGNEKDMSKLRIGRARHGREGWKRQYRLSQVIEH